MIEPDAEGERRRSRTERVPTGKSAAAFVSLKRAIMLGDLPAG